MKSLLTVLIIPLFLTVVNASPVKLNQDAWQSKTYNTGRFTGIFLDGSFKVQLIQGRDNFLEVQASDAKAFDYLNISNERGLLRINVQRKPFDFSKVTIFITFETLEKLEIEGGVQLETKGYLGLEDISIHLKGGTKIDFFVKAGDMTVVNEGGVLFHTEGVAESLNVRLYGAGHIDAGELQCRDVSFRIEGVGTGKVHATGSLNTVIMGAGKIRYKGDPVVSKEIEGLGSVEKE
jgi:hypothetical protein